MARRTLRSTAYVSFSRRDPDGPNPEGTHWVWATEGGWHDRRGQLHDNVPNPNYWRELQMVDVDGWVVNEL